MLSDFNGNTQNHSHVCIFLIKMCVTSSQKSILCLYIGWMKWHDTRGLELCQPTFHLSLALSLSQAHTNGFRWQPIGSLYSLAVVVLCNTVSCSGRWFLLGLKCETCAWNVVFYLSFEFIERNFTGNNKVLFMVSSLHMCNHLLVGWLILHGKACSVQMCANTNQIKM